MSAPGSATSSVGDPVTMLDDWIVECGLTVGELGPLMDGLCRRLEGLGIRILRLHASMGTLHPTLTALGGTWWRDRGFETERYARSLMSETRWQKSPFRLMIENNVFQLRRRLEGPTAEMDFPVLHEFRERGGTDWLACIVRFGGDEKFKTLPGIVISWLSDRPGGFTEADDQRIYCINSKMLHHCVS